MKKFDSLEETRKFKFLVETEEPQRIFSHLRGVSTILERLRARTKQEEQDLYIAQKHIKEARKLGKRLTEQVKTLEEQVRVLEEGKGK